MTRIRTRAQPVSGRVGPHAGQDPEPDLRYRRRLERCKPQERDRDSKVPAGCRLRKPGDLARFDQVAYRDKLGTIKRRCRAYAHSPDLDPTGNGFRTSRDEPLTVTLENRAVVRNQSPAPFNETQGEIRLSRPGWPAKQNSPPVNGDAGSMYRAVHPAPLPDRSGARGWRTTNRAPVTVPSAPATFSACIVPPSVLMISRQPARPMP